MKKLLVVLAAFLLLVMPLSVISAQGPTPTATSEFGMFGDLFSGTATPTSTTTSSSAGGDALKQALAQNNYVVVQSGNWYDAQGKPLADSVFVMMPASFSDPKSDAAVQQIVSGLSALRTQYPNAATYHVLLLNRPFVHDAFTTSAALQLLNSKLVTPEAFLQEVLAKMRTTNLVQGSVVTNATATATATATRPGVVASPTRVPTRKPTTATSTCNPPPGQARLWVKNGYSGVMRFTVGGGEWGTHDFDIPADGQFHYIDMPPSDKYTYSASIPGVGKASARLVDIFGPFLAGKCYYLPFQP